MASAGTIKEERQIGTGGFPKGSNRKERRGTRKTGGGGKDRMKMSIVAERWNRFEKGEIWPGERKGKGEGQNMRSCQKKKRFLDVCGDFEVKSRGVIWGGGDRTKK